MQTRFKQFMKRELPNVQAGFYKRQEQEIKSLVKEKSTEISKSNYQDLRVDNSSLWITK